MIRFTHRGSFQRTEKFFRKASKANYILRELEQYGREGVAALTSATPVDSSKTANAWDYEIVTENGKISIFWTNSNIVDGVNIAVILQYGHGTRNGGYVAGRDYINPAILPIFEKIADQAWREVTSS